MKNIIILLLILMPLCVTAQVTVTGVVKNTDGEELLGATVIEVGNNSNGAVTDFDGKFSIKLSTDNSKFMVRYLGLEPKTLSAASTPMIIILENDKNMLGEVEIVRQAFGTKTRISNVAAISQVGAKQLRLSPTASVQNALAGRLPGLFQIQSNGQPGKDAAEILIRGTSSFTGADQSPLVMIDDIESDMQTLSQMSINEIEDVAILKDAGSTAIFGIKGANGVILVTTKRGNKGPAKITFRTDIGLQQPTYKNKFLNSYESVSLIREMYRNDDNKAELNKDQYQDATLEHYRLGDMPYRYPNVDWYDLMYKKASLQQQYSVDIQGGTDKVAYFVSLGYLDQGGLLKDIPKAGNFNNDYYQRRYNIRSNFDIKVTNDFKIGINASGILAEINEPHLPNAREEGTFSIFRRLLGGRFTPWNYPAYNPDGSFGGRSGTSVNPLALMSQGGYNREFKNTVNGNITLDHKLDFITKGLRAKGSLAITNGWGWKRKLTRGGNNGFLDFEYDEESDSYKPLSVDKYTLDPLKAEQDNIDPTIKLNTRFDLTYNRSFGDHNVSALFLGNWISDRKGSGTPGNVISYSGKIGYDYNSRYIIDLSGTYNGSDRFPKDYRFDFFPAVSAGWNAAEEPYMREFFQKMNISTLKLRGSYGLTGSDSMEGGRYAYEETYKKENDYFFGESIQVIDAMVLTGLANKKVKWESEKKLNIGIDIRLLDDRISASIDYFYNRRNDILTKRSSMALYAGYVRKTLPNINLGQTENKGWDGEVMWNDKIGKDFNYFFKGIFTYAKNKIIEMDEAPTDFLLSRQTGRPIGAEFGYIADGFYKTQEEIDNGPYRKGVKIGDIIYRDLSGPDGVPDGVIDDYDRTEIGNSRPNFNYGLSFGFSYKNFDVSTLFQGATGSSITLESMLRIGGTDGRPMPLHQKRWTQYDTDGNLVTDPDQLVSMNVNAKYPRLSSQNGNNQGASTFWKRSADYLRWKNIEIGYNFPKKWFKKVGVETLRVYGSAQNLITWDDLSDFQVDPESSRTTNYNSSSVGPLDTYPQQRVFNIGCQIVF